MPCSEIGRRTFLSCCRVTLVAVISPPEKRQDGLTVQRIARGQKSKKKMENEAKIVGRSLCGRPLTDGQIHDSSVWDPGVPRASPDGDLC